MPKPTVFVNLPTTLSRLRMTKSKSLRILLNSSLVALGMWAFAAAQAQTCTREYAPICGQVVGQAPQTFPNRCMLDNAQARPIAQGECLPNAVSQPMPLPRPMPGSDSDTHGCKGSAGYVWNAELASCIRPWMSSAITLEVAAHRRKCKGLSEMQCLMVRELQDGHKKPRWVPLDGEIEGYTHAVGQRHLLRVRKDRHDDVPANAPSFTYKLIRTLP
jgi:hypothetical protein